MNDPFITRALEWSGQNERVAPLHRHQELAERSLEVLTAVTF